MSESILWIMSWECEENICPLTLFFFLVFQREMPARGSICGCWDWTWGSIQFVRGVAAGAEGLNLAGYRVLGSCPWLSCTFREVKSFLWYFSGFLVEIVTNLNLSFDEFVLFLFLLERILCLSSYHWEFLNIGNSRD